MAPRIAKLEPRSLPKYQKDTNMYSKFQKCRRDCHTRASRSLTMPKKHHQASQSGTYALGKTPKLQEKPVPTARGRLLAEGDVDPAAGSRDEPTRLPVEAPVAERKQAFEVQVTRALFS